MKYGTLREAISAGDIPETYKFTQKTLTEREKNEAIFQAVTIGNLEIIRTLIENGVNPNCTRSDGATPLHIASELGYTGVIKALLSLGADKEKRNLAGGTPLDFALHTKNDKSIRALGASPSHPAYGQPLLSQGILNPKLIAFLKNKGQAEGKAREILLDQGGNCNGWSFLRQYYRGINSPKEFQDILAIISQWDPNKDLLTKPLSEFKGFQGQPVSEKLIKKYGTLDKLLEQTVNDLAWFQHSSKDLQTGIKQTERLKQWDIIKDNKVQLETLYSFSNAEIKEAQLTELLKYASRWPDTWIDMSVFPETDTERKIGSTGHAISLYITPEGKFEYYDSNMHFILPETSSAETVSHMVMNALRKKSTLGGFSVHKFHPAENTLSGEMSPPSANKDYHWTETQAIAILTQAANSRQCNLIKQILQEGGLDAIQNKDTKADLLKRLMTAAYIKHDDALVASLTLAGALPLDSEQVRRVARIALEEDEIEGVLFAKLNNDDVDINRRNADGLSALHRAAALNFDVVIRGLFRNGHADLERTTELESDTALHVATKSHAIGAARALIKLGANLNAQNSDGKTPLHIAVENRNYELCKLLLENGADVKLQDNQGKTPLHIAASIGNYNLAKILMKQGADLFSTLDKNRKSAFQLAVDKGFGVPIIIAADIRVEAKYLAPEVVEEGKRQRKELLRFLGDKDRQEKDAKKTLPPTQPDIDENTPPNKVRPKK